MLVLTADVIADRIEYCECEVQNYHIKMSDHDYSGDSAIACNIEIECKSVHYTIEIWRHFLYGTPVSR